MKKFLNGMSMRKRMTLFFAVPTIFLLILLLLLAYPRIIGQYKNQLQYSFEQSVNQAVSFLESYIQNMTHLAEIVEYSGEVQEVAASQNFRKDCDYGEQYDEFYRLNKEFGTYEFSNSFYRFILYVPDARVYSQNCYYFYGESRLFERDDYSNMKEQFNLGKDYIGCSTERKSMDNQDTDEMVTLYHEIQSRTTGEKVGVCSVSMPAEEFRSVMENADITENGLVYLLNEKGEVIVNSNAELYRELSRKNLLPQNGDVWTFGNMQMDSNKYYISRQNVGNGGWQMISLIPEWEYEGQYQIFVFEVIFCAIIIAAAIALIAGLLSSYYVGRLTKLRMEMADLQRGNLNVQLPASPQGDEIEEVYRDFNFMVNEVQRLLQEHYQLGKNVKVAEIRALQAQINPHFLYNTLDLINWIAMDYGACEIENIAWNLARYYRLSLNHGKSVISIEEEVEHTQVYVNIENYHFDNAIEMTADVPEELKTLACLNIILQPFVENAIVHGIAEDSSITKCKIHIEIRREEGDIVFQIEDDGPGITPGQMEDAVSVDLSQTGKGYGVKNINFRIKLCFGEKYGVHYEQGLERGTRAIIRIPQMTVEEAMERMV